MLQVLLCGIKYEVLYIAAISIFESALQKIKQPPNTNHTYLYSPDAEL